MTELINIEEWQTTDEALDRLNTSFDDLVRSILRPPPRLTGSDWSNKYRILSDRTSALPGPYRWQVTPYAREILDVCTDREHQKVVMMMAARTSKSTVLENVLGFYTHQDPSPILVLLPDLGYVDWWSKNSLDPLLYDSRELRQLFDWSYQNQGNTKRYKTFPGGSISLVGSNSPAGLRGKTIRVLLADETDAFSDSTGDEGDPLSLAEVRTTTYQHRRKVILTSTPGLKGFSVIEEEFKKTDQRYYNVPCPNCQNLQTLKWTHEDGSFGLFFSDNPQNPTYICERCGFNIPESRKTWMLDRGVWIPTAQSDVAGFHLNGLYSPFMPWSELVKEWKAAQKNKAKLQVFRNTRLAETWDASEDRISSNQLAKRLEKYNSEVPTKEENVCNGVGVLTAGVDIQRDRIELLVLGSGADDELYCVDYQIWEGNTSQDDVWAQLQQFILGKTYKLKNGLRVRLKVVCVDSGFNTDKVYRFVDHMNKIQKKTMVFAIKGIQNHQRIIDDLPTQSKKYAASFRKVGTDMLKDHMAGIMSNKEAGPSYLHIPVSWPPIEGRPLPKGEERWIAKEFLDQLTAERPMIVKKGNKKTRQWVLPSGARNEAWDTLLYSYAGMRILGLDFLNKLDERATKLANAHLSEEDKKEVEVQEKVEEPTTIPLDAPMRKAKKKRRPAVQVHAPSANRNFWK